MPKNTDLQPMVVRDKGGAIKGRSHGARKLQKQIRAGQLRGNTLEGQSYYSLTGALFTLAEQRLGREPNAIELLAIEAVAEAALCRKMIFAWHANRESEGRKRPHLKTQEPFTNIPISYFRFCATHDKALSQLAKLLNTTPERIQGGLAGLDELRKPIDVKASK
jgi:hypothetical protein